jgi:hypothetical protein
VVKTERHRRVGGLVLVLTLGWGALCLALWSGSHLSETQTLSKFVEHDLDVEASPRITGSAECPPKPFVRAALSNEWILGELMEVDENPELKLFGPDKEGQLWTFANLLPTEEVSYGRLGIIARIGITNGHRGPLAEIEFDDVDHTASVLALNEEDSGSSYTRWTDVKGVVQVSSWVLDEHARIAVDLRGKVDGHEAELRVCAPLSVSFFQPLQPIFTRVTWR